MRFTIAAAAVALMLGGCVATQPRVYNIDTPFDEAQAKAQTQPGSNTLKGSAFLRQRGGAVVTCAGAEATLIPATEYATDRIRAIYGNTNKGQALYATKFSPDYTGYRTHTLKSTCDAQGNFVFERVADGSFYVSAIVRWEAGGAAQGGPIMQRVDLRGGETKSVILTGN